MKVDLYNKPISSVEFGESSVKIGHSLARRTIMGDSPSATGRCSADVEKPIGSRRLSSCARICGVATLVFVSFIVPHQMLYAGVTIEMETHQNANRNDTSSLEIIETVPVTIICQLSGEMGNNLGKLGHCLSLKWWLESGAFYNSTHKLGYSARVALRHQEHNKWIRGAKDLQRCFPNTNQFNFSEANNQDFTDMWKMQHQLFGGEEGVGAQPPFSEINTNDEQKIATGLRAFTTAAYEKHAIVYNAASRSNVSMPFLFANEFQLLDKLADQFYEENRQFFRLNETCCKEKADPDESVFHYRNFKNEMPKVWQSFGFHEASPLQAANNLFGHLRKGDKIAIVTRFSQETALPYVVAFEERGFKVRVIEGQDGPADFCFLMSAKKEVVGMIISTYLMWAGYLGNASRVIAYSLASSNHRHNVPNHNATSPGLKGKFDFRVI